MIGTFYYFQPGLLPVQVQIWSNRLNQLKKQLNLNPFHKDNDRFKLILLYHYFTKKYNGNHSSGEMP